MKAARGEQFVFLFFADSPGDKYRAIAAFEGRPSPYDIHVDNY
jgi:hypothetical protein